MHHLPGRGYPFEDPWQKIDTEVAVDQQGLPLCGSVADR